jgi:transcriptional regulator with XRE-family HTH domain
MTPGQAIKRRRLALGWTQARLADAAGLTQPTIADLERGRSEPRLSTLARLATAMGTTAADLLTQETT